MPFVTDLVRPACEAALLRREADPTQGHGFVQDLQFGCVTMELLFVGLEDSRVVYSRQCPVREALR